MVRARVAALGLDPGDRKVLIDQGLDEIGQSSGERFAGKIIESKSSEIRGGTRMRLLFRKTETSD